MSQVEHADSSQISGVAGNLKLETPLLLLSSLEVHQNVLGCAEGMKLLQTLCHT